MTARQAIWIWAVAFLAFERIYPARDSDGRHPVEVLTTGLITPDEFLRYLQKC